MEVMVFVFVYTLFPACTRHMNN